MSREVLIKCDRCSKPQTDKLPVRPCTIVGTPSGSPRAGRIDLCVVCRKETIMFAGYKETDADAIIKHHQARGTED